jgi:hypothetical protein
VTRDEQDVILDLFPESIAWSNAVRINGFFMGMEYGAFVRNQNISDVVALLDRSLTIEEYGSDSLVY